MPEKPLAPSTLKARRRRKPVFIDEFIQWHLSTMHHDRCVWCGLGPPSLTRMGSRKRVCLNSACRVTVELQITVKQWEELKLHNEPVPHLGGPAAFRLSATDYETFPLKEAQLQSGTGRGRVALATGFDTAYVFWHRVGHLPEDHEGTRCMAAGSPYWKMLSKLRKQKVWVPDDQLCAMEVIARAASDEPTFAIMRP
jgi:hypothetical protein